MAPLLRGLAGPIAAGLLLGLLGPFGTYASQDLPQRLGFWLTAVAGNWLLCDLAVRHLHARWPAGWAEPPWRRRLLLPLAASLIVLLPATAMVRLAGELFGGLEAAPLPLLAAQVLLLCAALSTLGYALAEGRDEPQAEPLAAAAPGSPEAEAGAGREAAAGAAADDAAFRRRLSPDPGGRLLWLRAEDHYLRVRTEGGETLVLCRLEDAAQELAGCGRRVHRSWWVAATAVVGASGGAQPRLRLSDGSEVPVSRSHRQALRKAGWLPPGRAVSGP